MSNSLFDNKLFQQYLAAAGSDIGSGKPIGANVNAVTNQNISSSNFMKLLQKMLGGNIPEGGKIEVSDTGMKIHVPSNAYSLPASQYPTAAAATGGSVVPAQQPVQNPFANPSSSPLDISSADLAGLSTADISKVLQFKMTQDELMQKKISDVADMAYKNQLIKESEARTTNLINPPVKDTSTTDMKNYKYAVSQGYTGSFEDWSKTGTTDWRDYQKAKDQGYEGSFYDWKKEMAALGGGLNLEEFSKRKEVTGDIAARQYFTNPKGLATDVDKYINSEAAQNNLFQYADNPREQQRQTIIEKAKFVESKITASGGKIQDVKMDGRTRVWKVKWPDGKVSEVRYGF